MLENYKTCSSCKKSKDLDEFTSSKKGKFGKHNYCKECNKRKRREWYEKHRDEEIKKACEYGKTEKAINHRKEHYQKNRDKILAENRIRSKTEDFKKKCKIRQKRAREKMTDQQRMVLNLRRKVSKIIKKYGKQGRFFELCGCTSEFLRDHIQRTWKEGMSWKNYGKPKNGEKTWEVDHITPCCFYDFCIPGEQYKCFHYKNLQALWKKENSDKRDYILDFQI